MEKNNLIENLVSESQKGNNDAFTELILTFKTDLFKIAKMRLICEDDVEDAIQETIIQAYKNIKKVKHPQFFKAWIIKILINQCNRIYKKSTKVTQVEYNEQINLSYIDNEENINQMDFYILIRTLTYNERISLTLYYLLDFTTKEISSILKEPEATIRSRISRAKLKLKEIYKEENNNGQIR